MAELCEDPDRDSHPSQKQGSSRTKVKPVGEDETKSRGARLKWLIKRFKKKKSTKKSDPKAGVNAFCDGDLSVT